VVNNVMTLKVIFGNFHKMTVLPLPIVAPSPNCCIFEVGLKEN